MTAIGKAGFPTRLKLAPPPQLDLFCSFGGLKKNEKIAKQISYEVSRNNNNQQQSCSCICLKENCENNFETDAHSRI